MRLHRTRFKSIFTGLLGLCILGPGSILNRAQALFNLHVGDDVSSSVLSTRAPKAKDRYKEYWVMKWALDSGNDLSMTLTEDGKVVYLESDWNGTSSETNCDLAWLKFGETTLSEIRKRLGSNGFEFKERRGVIEIPDGIVMMNSYDVGSSVVTFYTRISHDDYSKSKSPAEKWVIGDRAVLDAISIASADYAESEWGERIYDPAYKAVAWK